MAWVGPGWDLQRKCGKLIRGAVPAIYVLEIALVRSHRYATSIGKRHRLLPLTFETAAMPSRLNP